MLSTGRITIQKNALLSLDRDATIDSYDDVAVTLNNIKDNLSTYATILVSRKKRAYNKTSTKHTNIYEAISKFLRANPLALQEANDSNTNLNQVKALIIVLHEHRDKTNRKKNSYLFRLITSALEDLKKVDTFFLNQPNGAMQTIERLNKELEAEKQKNQKSIDQAKQTAEQIITAAQSQSRTILSDANAAANEKDENIQRMQLEISILEKKNTDLDAANNKTITTLQQKIAELESTVAQTSDSIHTFSEEVAQLNNTIEKSKHIEESLVDLNTEANNQLLATQAELEKLKSTLQTQTLQSAEIDSAKSRQILDLQSEIDTLRVKIKDIESTREEVEAHHAERLSELRTFIIKNAHIKDCLLQNEHGKSPQETVKNIASIIDNAELKAHRDQISDLQLTNSQQAEQIENLKLEVKTLRECQESLNRQLVLNHEASEEATSKNKQLESDLHKVKNENKKLKTALTTLIGFWNRIAKRLFPTLKSVHLDPKQLEVKISESTIAKMEKSALGISTFTDESSYLSKANLNKFRLFSMEKTKETGTIGAPQNPPGHKRHHSIS